MFARIVENTGWTIDAIGRLTVFQICEILGHARDANGNIEAADEGRDDEREAFKEEWRARGLTDDEIEQKYAEDLDVFVYRFGLSQSQDPDVERKTSEYRQRVVAKRQRGRY